jgi:hypothetical protein
MTDWHKTWQSCNKTRNVHINIILKHICITTVATQKQEVLHILSVCVYSLSYPVRNVRAPHYIVICGWYGYTAFFHTISETARFSKQKLSNKLWVVFWVYPRRSIFECWRFGTIYQFHLQRLYMKCGADWTWEPVIIPGPRCTGSGGTSGERGSGWGRFRVGELVWWGKYKRSGQVPSS